MKKSTLSSVSGKKLIFYPHLNSSVDITSPREQISVNFQLESWKKNLSKLMIVLSLFFIFIDNWNSWLMWSRMMDILAPPVKPFLTMTPLPIWNREKNNKKSDNIHHEHSIKLLYHNLSKLHPYVFSKAVCVKKSIFLVSKTICRVFIM